MLTPHQIRRLSVITSAMSKHAQRFGDGRMQFKIELLKGGAVMLVADNREELRWFETSYFAIAVIQPRGGISQYRGSMPPKLVLPVVPRLCEYDNPFKRSLKK